MESGTESRTVPACPSCGSLKRRRVGAILEADTDPGGPRPWVSRPERRGVTLSHLGRMVLLGVTDGPAVVARLAPTLPPPPAAPGERAGRQFLLLAGPALLLGALLAFVLFWQIMALPLSEGGRMMAGLALGVGPLLLLGIFLRPTAASRDEYLQELKAWDEAVGKVEQHWVCSDCDEIFPG